MNSFHRFWIIFVWVVGFIVLAPVNALEEVHGNLSLGKGNVFRGFQQGHSGLSYSGFIEKSWRSGLHAGIWAGRFDKARDYDRDAEINYFLGYFHRMKRGMAVDTALVHYQFPNANGYYSEYGQIYHRDYDWTEWQTTLYYRDLWVLTYGLGRGWLAEDKLSHFFEITRIWSLPLFLQLDVNLGVSFFESAPVDDYQYLALGLERTFGRFNIRAQFSRTDHTLRESDGSGVAGSQTSVSLNWLF